MASASKSRTNLVRLPLHRGPFYFAPHFLSSRDDWLENFTTLLATAADQASCKAEILSRDGWQLQAKLNTLTFTIDAEGGMFGLEEPDEDEDWRGPDRFLIAEIPSLFLERTEAEPIPEHLADDVRSARSMASWLHRAMKSRFERALENNDAQLEARFNSELSDFAKLDRDQFVLFDVIEKVREKIFERDDELDIAIAPASGAKLFSVCVVPAEEITIRALEGAPGKDGSAGGKRGRPRSVDHGVLDEIMLGLMRKRGFPGRTPAWNNERLQEAVVKQMAERGLTVSRPTVLKKIPLVIEMVKKERPHKHFRQSNNSKIYQN
jgi:hypothetical protein